MPEGAPDARAVGTPSRSPTVRHALTAAIGRLRAAGVVGAPLDAELLLADAMGRARGRLLANDAEPLAGAAAGRFERHLARRLAREPVSRILGQREGHAVGRCRADQRRAAHHHRADGVRRFLDRAQLASAEAVWKARLIDDDDRVAVVVHPDASVRFSVDLHAPAPALVIIS